MTGCRHWRSYRHRRCSVNGTRVPSGRCPIQEKDHMTTRTQTAGGRTGGAHGETVLEVRNLTKHFPVGSVLQPKQVHALNDASFTIGRGEVVALVGESGSGK